jgi:ankyrin repeat protein
MQIHTYAKEGDIDGVALELSRGIPIDATDGPYSRTPLMCAVASPNASAEMVRFLIERGADVNAKGGEMSYAGLYETVLGLSVQNRDIEKIKLLLDAGADIHYQRPYGYDVLIDAMHRGAAASDEALVPIVKLLIEKGARTDGVSDYSESALRACPESPMSDTTGVWNTQDTRAT